MGLSARGITTLAADESGADAVVGRPPVDAWDGLAAASQLLLIEALTVDAHVRWMTKPFVLAAVALLLPACMSGCSRPLTPERVFLERFAQSVTADTLRVGPPLDRTLGEPYPGVRLDSTGFRFFGEAYPTASTIDNGDGLSVVFRVPMNAGRVGYVLRVPSQYDASAADLWVFDEDSARWEAPLPLADEFGDGCWYFRREAWIVDIDGDGIRDVVRRERSSWIDEDSGEPGESDSLWVARGSLHGQAAYQHRLDSLLRLRFDVRPWTPMKRGDC